MRFPTSKLRSTIYYCVVHTRFPSTRSRPSTVCSIRMFHASLTITPKNNTHSHPSRNLFLQLSRNIELVGLRTAFFHWSKEWFYYFVAVLDYRRRPKLTIFRQYHCKRRSKKVTESKLLERLKLRRERFYSVAPERSELLGRSKNNKVETIPLPKQWGE